MQSFPSSVRASVFVVGLVSAVLGSAVRADTVYLKNGAYIDGIVTARNDLLLTITIGEIGKLEVSMDDVLRVEKNSRGGWRAYVPVDQRKLPDVVQQKNAGTGETPKDEDDETGDGDATGDGDGGNTDSADESEASTDDAGSVATGEEDGESAGEQGDIDPKLKAEIEKLVEDLQRQKTKFRRRAERKLRKIGPPAVPFLLPLVTRGGDLTRITAVRLVSEHAKERDPEVVEACLKALSDENYFVRDYSAKTLRRLTEQDFGFDPRSGSRTRRRAVLKWEKWWEQEKAKYEDADSDLDDDSDLEDDSDRGDEARNDEDEDGEAEDDEETGEDE